MKRSNLFFVFFALLLFSCEKVIEYKGPGGTPRLVLNAIMENDSAFVVRLERTVFFLSPTNTNRFIESGAVITLKDETNNISYTNPVYLDSGRYQFPISVNPNIKYSIKVTHPDFPEISSVMTTQPKVTLLGVDTSSFVKNQERWLRVKYKFNDPSGENFYIIKGKIFYSSPDWEGEYPISFLSNDPSVDNSENQDIDGSIYPNNNIFVYDTKFNGQYKELELTFSHPGDDQPAWEINNDLQFELYAMDKATFLYNRSVIKNMFTDEFSEPVKVYSNINGGFGIFGTMSRSVIKLQ
jgi:hypothetical protein